MGCGRTLAGFEDDHWHLVGRSIGRLGRDCRFTGLGGCCPGGGSFCRLGRCAISRLVFLHHTVQMLHVLLILPQGRLALSAGEGLASAAEAAQPGDEGIRRDAETGTFDGHLEHGLRHGVVRPGLQEVGDGALQLRELLHEVGEPFLLAVEEDGIHHGPFAKTGERRPCAGGDGGPCGEGLSGQAGQSEAGGPLGEALADLAHEGLGIIFPEAQRGLVLDELGLVPAFGEYLGDEPAGTVGQVQDTVHRIIRTLTCGHDRIAKVEDGLAVPFVLDGHIGGDGPGIVRLFHSRKGFG